MTGRASRSSAELLHEIRTRMSKDPSWSEPFERLAQAISQVDPLSSSGDTLICTEVQRALDVVVADEMAGVDVDRRHQDVLVHLAGCRDCRLTHTLLRQILAAEPKPPAAAHTPAPVPIPPTARPSGNGLVVRSSPLTIEIAREVIGRALSGPRLAFARGETGLATTPDGERATLLYSDIVLTRQGEVFVQVSARQYLDRPDRIDLEVELASDWALPGDMEVQLSWAGIRRSEPVTEEGNACFRDLAFPRAGEPEADHSADRLTLTVTRTGDESL